jgi:ATP-dependent Clp protease ATP-binding subunit ClpX
MDKPEEIKCSFCNKDRSEVEQMIEGPTFHNHNIYICNECVDITHDTLHKQEIVKISKKKEKILPPEQIKAYLDEYVIGQDNAKIAISVAMYNHFKRLYSKSKIRIDKSNLLMVGPSGTGKTILLKTIAELFDLPYIIADATSFTEAGYSGEDVDSLIKRLIQTADGDIEKAQTGIIFIDEIDKKSKRLDNVTISRDVSGEGVQQALLKLIEGTVVTYEDEFGDIVEFDTTNVLFVSSGAFVGLAEVIKKNSTSSSIGINASVNKKLGNIIDVTPDDLIKYGLIPEFVGRHPVIVVFEELTREMMVKILTEPKNNIVSQFKALFKYENISLEFNDKYLLNVSDECLKQKIGARGLRSIIERNLQSLQYILPSLAKSGVNKIYINDDGTSKYTYKKRKINNLTK